MAEQPQRRKRRYRFEIRPAEHDSGADVDVVQTNMVTSNGDIWTLTLPELFDLQDTLDAWIRERTRQAWERMRGNDSPE